MIIDSLKVPFTKLNDFICLFDLLRLFFVSFRDRVLYSSNFGHESLTAFHSTLPSSSVYCISSCLPTYFARHTTIHTSMYIFSMRPHLWCLPAILWGPRPQSSPIVYELDNHTGVQSTAPRKRPSLPRVIHFSTVSYCCTSSNLIPYAAAIAVPCPISRGRWYVPMVFLCHFNVSTSPTCPLTTFPQHPFFPSSAISWLAAEATHLLLVSISLSSLSSAFPPSPRPPSPFFRLMWHLCQRANRSLNGGRDRPREPPNPNTDPLPKSVQPYTVQLTLFLLNKPTLGGFEPLRLPAVLLVLHLPLPCACSCLCFPFNGYQCGCNIVNKRGISSTSAFTPASCPESSI